MPDTPPVGPRGLALRCAAQGAAAFAAGVPLLACPYGAARPFARRAWVVGYVGEEYRSGARRLEDVDLVDDDAPTPEPLDTARPTT